MLYKHKIVRVIAELIDKYGDEGIKNVGGKFGIGMLIKPIWQGFKGEIPGLLQSLDSNEEAVEAIRQKLLEILELEEVAPASIPEPPPAIEPAVIEAPAEVEPLPIEDIKEAVKKAPPKRKKPKKKRSNAKGD